MKESNRRVAESVHSFFSDSSVDDLEKVVGRYREANVWCDTPYFNSEGFNLLMDVMMEAGELEKRAPYEKLVDNSFVEEVVK